MINNGFLKVGSANINTKIGKPMDNVLEILNLLNAAEKASVIVFPELCISSYTCGDILFTNKLYEETKEAVDYLILNNKYEGVIIVGCPLDIDGVLFNTAFAIQKNKLLGIVPKMYLPNTNEFYEKRWFRQGVEVIKKYNTINYLGKSVPFGSLIFENEKHNVKFGIEICEDMWAPISPSIYLSINGCNLICNLSASNEVVNKDKVRLNCVSDLSRRNCCGYIYSSSNASESSGDTVFSGNNIICCTSEVLANTFNFDLESKITYANIDIPKLNFSRRSSTSFRDLLHTDDGVFQKVSFDIIDSKFDYLVDIDKTPFIPKEEELDFFHKATLIQVKSLIKRLKSTKLNKVVLGISGGLDSTLALLVTVLAFDDMNIDRKNIIAITMPGLATSSRTKNNAHELMNLLGVTSKEIDLNNHINEQFKLIGHNGKEDITYENTQARLRVMTLLNISNMENALVVGTSDLSEIALGWCTFGGDQLSGYNVNAGVPKTLVKFLVKKHITPKTEKVLLDILNTPISPELKENQETEKTLGSYDVIDFILYRYVSCGDTKERIYTLVKELFNEEKDIVDNFFRRFFTQQFKKNTMPDGPKVLDFSLSSRDYKMPSDIDA